MSPVPHPPTDPAQQLQWLVDRAAISDLMIEYARAVDDHDWDALASVFDDAVVFTLPGLEVRGRSRLIAGAADREHGLAAYEATHHLNTNHQIHIDGDTATARAYVISAHVRSGDRPHEHGDAGGWWDYEFRRTPDGWRCTRAALTVKWVSGDDLPGAARESS